MKTPTSSNAGFTLVEVLLAVVILATVGTTLSTLVMEGVHNLGEARAKMEAIELGEDRLREIQEAARGGELPELGSDEGDFEEGSAYHWVLNVEPFSLPLPENAPEGPPTSSLFVQGSTQQGANQPSILKVSFWVLQEGQETEDRVPMEIFVVEGPNETQLPEPTTTGSGLSQTDPDATR